MLTNKEGQVCETWEELYFAFAEESNMIERIMFVTPIHVESIQKLVDLPSVSIDDVVEYVHHNAPDRPLRKHPGMDVMVGDHIAEPGGPLVEDRLRNLLECAEAGTISPWEFHVQYENLHPFMDGNGRSGRALWLRYMKRERNVHYKLGFLHAFYYQTLSALDSLTDI